MLEKNTKFTREYLGEEILQWNVGESVFRAWPERGARVMSWWHKERPVIFWPEIESPGQIARTRGGNPILFPFCARTFHQGKIHFWKDPAGVVREMPMHGIARQGTFALTDLDDGGFRARLIPAAGDAMIYPFDYHFEVSYSFSESKMTVEFLLENLGDAAIPWSAGHHFYFTLPWAKNTSREDYQLTIPATSAWRHAVDGSLIREDFAASGLLSNPAWVDRIHLGLFGQTVYCECLRDHSRLAIKIQGNDFSDNAIVTWTQDDASPYFCIEPWMGPPNGPETGNGVRWVGPKATGKFTVSVWIE